jgi:hypothetical protein
MVNASGSPGSPGAFPPTVLARADIAGARRRLLFAADQQHRVGDSGRAITLLEEAHAAAIHFDVF